MKCLYTDANGMNRWDERDMIAFHQLLSTFPPGSSSAITHDTMSLPFPYHFGNLLHYLQMGTYSCSFTMTFRVETSDRAMLVTGIKECRERITQVSA